MQLKRFEPTLQSDHRNLPDVAKILGLSESSICREVEIEEEQDDLTLATSPHRGSQAGLLVDRSSQRTVRIAFGPCR
jgi:hypothetical protein